jgi:hypothetical protein
MRPGHVSLPFRHLQRCRRRSTPIGCFSAATGKRLRNEDLRGVIMSLGIWGQRWVESSLSLKHLDPAFLMWDSGAISNRGRWPIVDAPWSSSFLRSAAGADTGGSCSTRWISTIGSSVGVASMR